MTLRIVIAEDNYLVREGLVRLLADDDIEVLDAVKDAQGLIRAAGRPDVQAVLTDIRMPPNHSTDGIEAALAIRKRRPDVGVVVLSQHVAGAYAFALFINGTAGLAYLLKERVGDREELVRALHATAAGGSVIDPVVVEHLLLRERREMSSPLAQLTDRELSVLSEMAHGSTNPAIAKKLFVSESAVSKHIGAIFDKLGLNECAEVDRRVSAVITYLRERAEP